MNKTKIEWTDYTWNPIKGMCPTGCWYCYARRMYQRFKWDEEVRFELLESLENITYKNRGTTFGDNIKFRPQSKIKKGSKIFVCSTFELFHPVVKRKWQDKIFETIELNPQHIFQILTKFPQNIDRYIPDNCWLGVTVTGSHERFKLNKLLQNKARLYFASFEPLGGYVKADGYRLEFSLLNWIIIGGMTGHGKRYRPEKEWIELIVKEARRYKIPLFLKDNLIPIMGKEYVMKFREFPK